MKSGLLGLWFALALACLNGLLYLFIVPPWQHYDEPGHFEYAWLIANRPSLPQPGDYDQAMRQAVAASMIEHGFFRGMGTLPNLLQDAPIDIGISQIDRYPVYYWLAALPLRLTRATDITLQMYAARAMSLLLFLVSILGCWGMIRELTRPENPLRWVLPASLALLPAYADIMTAINNDVAAAAFATLLLWGMVRLVQRGFSVGCLMWCTGWSLACFWTKPTTYPVIAALALALLLSLLKDRARLVVWGLLGVSIGLTLLLNVQWDEAHSWLRVSAQESSGRRSAALAHSGNHAFEVASDALPFIYRQVIPRETVNSLRGEVVLVGAWMWTNSPNPQYVTTPALMFENRTPSLVYQTITLTQQPAFYAFTTTLPQEGGRVWLTLGSQNLAAPASVFYDDVVLKKDGLDLNLVRNSSAEWGSPRFRSALDNRLARIIGFSPSYLLSAVTDPIGAQDYLERSIDHLVQTFWARFGWGHVLLTPPEIYPLLNAFTLASILGSLFVLALKARGKQRITASTHTLALLSLTLAMCWLATWFRGTPSLIERWWLPSSRYVFPVVAPTLLAIIGGWLTLPDARVDVRQKLGIGTVGALFALNLLSLISIAQFYAT